MNPTNYLRNCSADTWTYTPKPLGLNTGIPYCWGGGNSVPDFLIGISGTGKAGNICTSTEHNPYGHISNTYGVDCSGLVTRAWERPEAHLGTDSLYPPSLPDIGIKIPLLDAVRRGDIFNKEGDHTEIFERFTTDGRLCTVESSRDHNKVQRWCDDTTDGAQPRTWGYIKKHGDTAWRSPDVTDDIAGELRLDRGVTVPAVVTRGQTFTCGFHLQEVYNAPRQIKNATCSVIDADGKFQLEFPKSSVPETVPALGTWEYFASRVANLRPGTYRAVALINGPLKSIAPASVVRTFSVGYTLKVAFAGDGTGFVPVGYQTCIATCFKAYPVGTTVTLSPTAGAGSTFVGWTGACSGTGLCTVTMDSAQTVTANFSLDVCTSGSSSVRSATVETCPDYGLSVTSSGSGSGRVSSTPPGIDCGSDCSERYAPGTSVTLTASADAGSTFSSWSGCDSTSSDTCTITMSSAKSVTAIFALSAYGLSVSKTGTGTGTVISSPGGINCGSDCGESYPSGTSVSLTATADSGSTFSGWSGCTSASGNSCSITMDSSKSVTASFSHSAVTTELIQNGSFSSGGSSWTLAGDFWAGSSPNYHTSPGYAAAGVDAGGVAKNNASGSMWQSFSVPSSATAATMSIWINVTSQEGTTTPFDYLDVALVDGGGRPTTLLLLDNRSKVADPKAYTRYTFDLMAYRGQSRALEFTGSTDGSNTTVFRIDDVSVLVTTP